MNRVKIGQSFFDKVTQFTGSFENAFEASILNGISVTDDVVIGETFKYGDVTNKRVVSFFNVNNEPATAIKNLQALEPVENVGIGYMIIGSTFKVR